MLQEDKLLVEINSTIYPGKIGNAKALLPTRVFCKILNTEYELDHVKESRPNFRKLQFEKKYLHAGKISQR